MRVYIEHRNRQGLIFFWVEHYDVSVRVVFTEEEEAIIRTYNLYPIEIVEEAPIFVSDGNGKMRRHEQYIALGAIWRRTVVRSFRLPLEAKAFELKVRDGLRNLRNYIRVNAYAPLIPGVFELR